MEWASLQTLNSKFWGQVQAQVHLRLSCLSDFHLVPSFSTRLNRSLTHLAFDLYLQNPLTLHYDISALYTLNCREARVVDDGSAAVTPSMGGVEWQEPHSGHSTSIASHHKGIPSIADDGAIGTQPLQEGGHHYIFSDSTREGEAVSSCCYW